MVTIFSCPDGKCTEVYKYSDWKKSECCSWFKALPNIPSIKSFSYFTSKVDCNEIVLNTNEMRVRFSSDGPTPKDIDTLTSNFVYQGFSAVYVSSSSAATAEVIGCTALNKTLTSMEGTVYSLTSWLVPWAASAMAGEPGSHLLRGGNIPVNADSSHVLYTEFLEAGGGGRDCASRYSARESDATFSGECGDDFGRGQTKWWIIKPAVATTDAEAQQKIELIFHGLVLEDGLDELTLFVCNKGVCQQDRTISGAYPFRGTEGRTVLASVRTSPPTPSSTPPLDRKKRMQEVSEDDTDDVQDTIRTAGYGTFVDPVSAKGVKSGDSVGINDVLQDQRRQSGPNFCNHILVSRARSCMLHIMQHSRLRNALAVAYSRVKRKFKVLVILFI